MSDAAPPPAFMDADEIAPKRSVTFTLPFALASLNVRQRKHWAVLHSEQTALAMEVMTAIGGPRYYPRPPFERAHITVVRCSAGTLDPDNLAASCKPLLDALCARSPRHPTGQGIIVDDASSRIVLEVRQEKADPGVGATIVRVDNLGAMPAVEKPAKKPKRARAYTKPSSSQIARFERARGRTL